MLRRFTASVAPTAATCSFRALAQTHSLLAPSLRPPELGDAFRPADYAKLYDAMPDWDEDLAKADFNTINSTLVAAGFPPLRTPKMANVMLKYIETQKPGTVAEALRLIDPTTVWQMQLTQTALPYQPQGNVLGTVDKYLAYFRDKEKLEAVSTDKGQPIIATGATTGVGKSRLLEEVRSKALKKGTHVVAVSYNSLTALSPTDQECNINDLAAVRRCFRSRVLCAMLPKQKLDDGRPTPKLVSTRFDVSDLGVVEVLRKKFDDGKDVLILVDEVARLGTPGKDEALNAVVSTLGDLCHQTSSRFIKGGKCIGFFTALSQAVVAAAKTNSGRNILTPFLPLLDKAEVDAIIKDKHPKADDVALDHIYAITAGHARSVAQFASSKTPWHDGTCPKYNIHQLIATVCDQSSRFVVTEADIRAILLEDSTVGVDFQRLSRESVVHVNPNGSPVLVPAFLYKWAGGHSGTSRLAKHVKACLDAAWERIHVSGRKEGADGKAFEKFLWHYEAVRRELLRGQPTTVHEFYRLGSTPSKWKWTEECVIPPITGPKLVANPSNNKWENFDVGATIVDATTRYEPTSGNFPKYDWLGAVRTKDGAIQPIATQTKHGSGNIGTPADGVISVKMTSLDATAVAAWTRNGWLVLGRKELQQYLGSTMAAAAASLLYFPKAKGPKTKNPKTKGPKKMDPKKK